MSLVYQRPWIQRPSRAVRVQSPPSVLMGLGELGDDAVGAGASGSLALFTSYLQNYIAAKAGPAALANVKNSPSFVGTIGICASIFLLGEANQLPLDQQAYWNQWRAGASNAASPDNVGWVFGRLVANSKDDLIAAASSYGSWWTDPGASAASFTLVDTTSTGTTWYGGTVVQSALTNEQWNTIFIKAWNVLLKGVKNGVLPLTYLEVLCRGVLQQPASRRMPVFLPPPGNLTQTDPKAIAFRAAMKQLGWSGVVSSWYGYTQQTWAAANSAFETQDAEYASAITSLNYISGEKILEEIQSKFQDYWQARTTAAAALADFDTMLHGPLAGQINPADANAMMAILQQFQTTDQMAYNTLSTAGLWPGTTQPGALNGLGTSMALGLIWGHTHAQRRGLVNPLGLSGLGAVQMIIAGILAVTALGVIAYVVSLMTAVGRSAAAQTKATADSILGTVDTIKASCQRTYLASPKDAAAEKALQDCLANTQALYKTIPPPPDSSDPMGLKYVALLGAVGVAGLIAVGFLKHRSK